MKHFDYVFFYSQSGEVCIDLLVYIVYRLMVAGLVTEVFATRRRTERQRDPCKNISLGVQLNQLNLVIEI